MTTLGPTNDGMDLENYAAIQGLVQKEIADAAASAQSNDAYGMKVVPQHRHTGLDSDQIDYADLKGKPEVSQAPQIIPFYDTGASFVDYVYGASFSDDWETMVAFWLSAGGGGSFVWYNPSGKSYGTFLKKDNKNFLFGSETGTVSVSAYDRWADRFIYAKYGGTQLYSIGRTTNHDGLGTETTMSTSGSTIGSYNGIATDESRVYILDGGTNIVKKFENSGGILVYESTITLANSDAKTYFTVDKNYIYTSTVTSAYAWTYWIFDKKTGLLVSTGTQQKDSGTYIRGLTTDPDGVVRMVTGIGNTTQVFTWGGLLSLYLV